MGGDFVGNTPLEPGELLALLRDLALWLGELL
jgi:hypothetical protein